MDEIYRLLHLHPSLVYLAAGMIGALFGSFLNAAIHRLPRNISLVTRTRSFCPSCQHNLAWSDNVPLLSYLVLMGRCRYCKAPIGKRYFLVEAVTVCLFLLIAHHALILNPGVVLSAAPHARLGIIGALPLLVFACCMVIMIVTDWETFQIMSVTLILPLAVSLILAWFNPDQYPHADHWFSHTGWGIHANALMDAVLGAGLASGATFGIGALWEWWKRVPAMGDGDVILMAAIGATVGWKLGFVTFILAAFLGLLIGLSMVLNNLISGKEPRKPVFDVTDDGSYHPPFWDRLVLWVRAPVGGFLLLVLCLPLFFLGQPSGKTTAAELIRLMAPVLGIGMGGFFILFHIIRKHHIAKGTWTKVKVEETEDGRKQEVYDQGGALGYLPFGPMLAVSGFICTIWGTWIMRMLDVYFMHRKPLPGIHEYPFQSVLDLLLSAIG